MSASLAPADSPACGHARSFGLTRMNGIRLPCYRSRQPTHRGVEPRRATQPGMEALHQPASPGTDADNEKPRRRDSRPHSPYPERLHVPTIRPGPKPFRSATAKPPRVPDEPGLPSRTVNDVPVNDPTGTCPSITSMTARTSAAPHPAKSWSVQQKACVVTMTFSKANRGSSAAAGFWSKTSSPVPAIRPFTSILVRTARSTTGPRAVTDITNSSPGFRNADGSCPLRERAVTFQPGTA